MSSDADAASRTPDEGGARAAARLARALADVGIACTVEARARLAVVTASPASAAGLAAGLADAVVRRRVVALGRACGFTHVALSVAEE